MDHADVREETGCGCLHQQATKHSDSRRHWERYVFVSMMMWVNRWE